MLKASPKLHCEAVDLPASAPALLRTRKTRAFAQFTVPFQMSDSLEPLSSDLDRPLAQVQSTSPAGNPLLIAILSISAALKICRIYCWHLARSYWLLLALFAAFQIADVVTTNYALATPGVWEANPLMALLQDRLGAAWWLPKVGVVGFVCLATPLLRRRWPMILVVSYYAVIVSINLAHL